MTKYKTLANKIGELVDEKNKAYGDSFNQTGDFLKLLYPSGISPEKYSDMLCIVRIFDKLKRIATAKDAFGESPYQDIVGYALLGTQKDIDKKVAHETEKLTKPVKLMKPVLKIESLEDLISNFSFLDPLDLAKAKVQVLKDGNIVAFDGMFKVSPEMIEDIYEYHRINIFHLLLEIEKGRIQNKGIGFIEDVNFYIKTVGSVKSTNGVKLNFRLDVKHGSDIIYTEMLTDPSHTNT